MTVVGPVAGAAVVVVVSGTVVVVVGFVLGLAVLSLLEHAASASAANAATATNRIREVRMGSLFQVGLITGTDSTDRRFISR